LTESSLNREYPVRLLGAWPADRSELNRRTVEGQIVSGEEAAKLIGHDGCNFDDRDLMLAVFHWSQELDHSYPLTIRRPAR
jgi:hypothetical protein